MATLETRVIKAAYAGLDLDSAPDSLREGCALDHQNFVLHNEDKMAMRGPLLDPVIGTNYDGHFPLASPKCIVGVWSAKNRTLVAYNNGSSTSTIEPWQACYIESSLSDLAVADTTMICIEYGVAGSVINVAGSQDSVIAGKGVHNGDYVYGLGYSSSTNGTNRLGYARLRHVLRWNMSASAPTVLMNAPLGAIDVTSHLERIWAIGGVDVPGGGTTTIVPNALYYSDPGGPVADTANEWRNDVSGLTNKILVGDPDDPGVALAVAGQTLLIFKRRSIYALYGYDDDTFSLRRISSSYGCADARSVVEADDGVYFMSASSGYCFCNESGVTQVDYGVHSELIKWVHLVSTGPGMYLSCNSVDLGNEYIMVFITSYAGLLSQTYTWSYLFHTPTRRWSRFATDGGYISAAGHLSSYGPVLFTDKSLAFASRVTTPEVDVTGVDRGPFGSKAIRAKWDSELIPLSTPPRTSQLHRLMFDYNFRSANQAYQNESGWYVTLRTGNNTTLLPEFQVPNMYSMYPDYFVRRRHVADVFSEATDLQLRVEWRRSTDPFDLYTPFIFDGSIEYQTARQRRSS